MEPALVAAAVTLVYRLVAAVVYRGRPLVAIMAEDVPASEPRDGLGYGRASAAAEPTRLS
jgi:hypothetical protein